MFNLFRKDTKVITAQEIALAERKKIQDRCEHKNFTMYGHNLIGESSCRDCGYTDKSYIFYNALTDRLIKLEERLNNVVS